MLEMTGKKEEENNWFSLRRGSTQATGGGHTAMTPGKQVTRPLEPLQAQVLSNLLVGMADAFLHLHTKVSISSCWFI